MALMSLAKVSLNSQGEKSIIDCATVDHQRFEAEPLAIYIFSDTQQQKSHTYPGIPMEPAASSTNPKD